MGCAIARSEIKRKNTDALFKKSFSYKRAHYENSHKDTLSRIMTSEFCEDIRQAEDIRQNSIDRLDKLVKKYQPKLQKVSKEELTRLLCEMIGENLIKKYFLIPSIDIFKTVKSIYSLLGFKEENINAFKSAMEPFEKEFEMDMRGIVIDITKETDTLAQCQFEGIISTMKFNSDYQPNILTLILNMEFFNKQEVAYDIAELIHKTKTIKIVNLIINPIDENGVLYDSFGLDGAYYKILYKLFEAIANNRSIRALFFHSMKNYNLVMAPEIASLIIKKMQSETLLALHFGNVQFSSAFYQKMLFQIISTRSLLFFSLHSELIGRVVNEQFLPSLIRNNSITSLCFTGFTNEDNEQIEKFKTELKEKNPKIIVIYCGMKSLIQLPFKYYKNK